ncbi:MAG: aromatic ring-hydroxylating dioxygenase subunit alpha [Burkholderiaceae bacterium]
MSVTPAPHERGADPVHADDWHPVAASASLVPGTIVPTRLLGTELAVWRDAGGRAHAWEDRCPHRGLRFSCGVAHGDGVVCGYHGWTFDAQGHCVHVPAHPGVRPSARACARTFEVRERYGLVWACLGAPARDVVPFPEYDDARLRKVLCGPYDVACSGPRIVENFLDMPHFAFVHAGILGDAAHAQVEAGKVLERDDAGPQVSGCLAWQPRSNALSLEGSDVEYTYRVVRPLTAILTKFPRAQPEFREAISLHVQPLGEESSRAWIVLAMTNFEDTDEDLRAFQDTIFLQDQPIVENQVPRRLPLAPDAEVSMACDRMSLAYRRYLVREGLRYGVVPAGEGGA